MELRVCARGLRAASNGLQRFGHEATWYVLIFDMDNPKQPGSTIEKVPNDHDQIARWEEQLSRPEMDGFGWLITENGVRIWKPRKTARSLTATSSSVV